MVFFNSEHEPFFAVIGEIFLIVIALQLILNVMGYPGYLVEQKSIWLACGSLAGYLLNIFGLHMLKRVFPD